MQCEYLDLSSLLVAFSPVSLIASEAAQPGEWMRDGDVRWVPGSRPVSIAAASSVSPLTSDYL